ARRRGAPIAERQRHRGRRPQRFHAVSGQRRHLRRRRRQPGRGRPVQHPDSLEHPYPDTVSAVASPPQPRFLSQEMGRRELLLTVGALMLCVFLAALDSSIVANALPRVVADLHGFELYAWVTTGYLLSRTAVTPLGGRLGDRYGRKSMLIGGSTFFLAVTLLCGLAQSMPQLIALRTLQGVGGGILTATTFATLGQLLPPADRARMSG